MIAQRIKYERLKKRLSQLDLSRCSGIRSSTISRIETGADPLFSNAAKIAAALEISLYKLAKPLSETERQHMREINISHKLRRKS
jgi:transcriptional regulator with XRE-family HTH domain